MPTTIKYMDLITDEMLSQLLDEEGPPCLSIFLPMFRKGQETQQNVVRMRNMLRRANELLREHGCKDAEIHELMDQTTTLLDQDRFWQYQMDGLAIFISKKQRHVLRLPIHFDEKVVVNHHFHLKPLLPLMTGDGEFYVLALSQGGVKLHRATKYTVEEVPLKNIPANLEESMKYDTFDSTTQNHAGTGRETQPGMRTGFFHGHGGQGDMANEKERILEYLKQVERGVSQQLKNESHPLILAGVEYMRGLYGEINHYPNIAAHGIDDGNVERLTGDELHQRAWQIVEEGFQQKRQDALNRYRRLAEQQTDGAKRDFTSLAADAYYRRVDTLFIAANAEIFGKFQAETGTAETHRSWQTGDEDLTDFTAFYTMKYGGCVYLVEPPEMPHHEQVAGLIRV